jgi:hypothetical protein
MRNVICTDCEWRGTERDLHYQKQKPWSSSEDAMCPNCGSFMIEYEGKLLEPTQSPKAKNDPHNDIYGPGNDNYGRDEHPVFDKEKVFKVKEIKSAEEILTEQLWFTSRKSVNSRFNGDSEADVDLWGDIIQAMHEYHAQFQRVPSEILTYAQQVKAAAINNQ